MTNENDALCEDLRAGMKSPAMELPAYSADPAVQRRVGRILANFDATVLPRAKRKLVVNSIQTGVPQKLGVVVVLSLIRGAPLVEMIPLMLVLLMPGVSLPRR
jgi:hypothetical protein